MDRNRIHPSHDVRENGSEGLEYGPDPHSTGWYCARCKAYTCELCPEGGGAGDDDELRAPCPGAPWWERV